MVHAEEPHLAEFRSVLKEIPEPQLLVLLPMSGLPAVPVDQLAGMAKVDLEAFKAIIEGVVKANAWRASLQPPAGQTAPSPSAAPCTMPLGGATMPLAAAPLPASDVQETMAGEIKAPEVEVAQEQTLAPAMTAAPEAREVSAAISAPDLAADTAPTPAKALGGGADGLGVQAGDAVRVPVHPVPSPTPVATPKATVKAPGTPGPDEKLLMSCVEAISDEFTNMLDEYRGSHGFEGTADLLRKLDEVQLTQLIDAARRSPEFRSFQKFNSTRPPDDDPHYAAMFGVGSDEERLENVISFRLWQTACKRVLASRDRVLERVAIEKEPAGDPRRREPKPSQGIQKLQETDPSGKAEPKTHEASAAMLAVPKAASQVPPAEQPMALAVPASSMQQGAISAETVQALMQALQQVQSPENVVQMVTQALGGKAAMAAPPSPPKAPPPPQTQQLVAMPPPKSIPPVVNSSTHPNEYANLRRFVEKNVHCEELAKQWESGA